MKTQKHSNRDKLIAELSKKNRCYSYERYKNYLSPHNRETEVKALTKDLKV